MTEEKLPKSALSSAFNSAEYLPLNEDDIFNNKKLTVEEKKKNLNSLLLRASSNNDITRVDKITSSFSDIVDINCKDDDGMTSLMLGAAFGHSLVVSLLIQKNAMLDAKDKRGWTGLFWAVANGHEETAKLLLDAGASRQAKSNRGRSLKDLARQSKHISLDDGEETDINDVSFEVLEEELKIDSAVPEEEVIPFIWEKCNWDQMFVFEESAIPHILKVAIHQMRPSVKSSENQKPISANILFLCLRYAHYYNSKELMTLFFNSAIKEIIQAIQPARDDLNFISYWIFNSSQLLFYLKKDQGLLCSTFDLQFTLTELIQELSIVFIKDVEKRIGDILEASILDYSSVEVNVKFEGILDGYNRTGSFLKSILSSTRQIQIPNTSSASTYKVAPITVISILTSAYKVLIQMKVDSRIIEQIFNQIFFTIGCDTFNTIIKSNMYCCRTKGVQIRVNFSLIEEFIKETFSEETAENFIKHLDTTFQLLQFLQGISSCTDLQGFLENLKSVTKLNLCQVKLVIDNYLYEVGEVSIPEEVRAYVDGVVKGMKEHSIEKKNSIECDEEENVEDVAEFIVKRELPFKIPKIIEKDGKTEGLGNPYVNEAVLEMLDGKSTEKS
ncbi:hypothetical protein HDU92_004536 [Lobulomyces angularis]|nr:hypothetical protein HDU92_004536 [Lobulomyces angularis]